MKQGFKEETNLWKGRELERLKHKIDNELPIDVIEGRKIVSIFGYEIVWWGLSYKKRCIAVYKENTPSKE